MFGERNKTARRGYALVVVLLIIMAIAILSMGFLARSDVELACGENMIIKTQMDYLAESALEHAKGLILNPQDVASEYWTGAARQQLFAGSDYYDVNVTKLGELNYQITGTAYREKGGEQVGRSSLKAQLRLNPCIVYWQSDNQDVSSSVIVTGDAYFGNDVTNYGMIYGDVYSAKTITNVLPGQIQGQKYPNVSQAPCNTPGISYSNFSSTYYIGANSYSVGNITPGDYNSLSLSPSGTNPAGIYYCNGNLNLKNNATVNCTGTLVVNGDLTIQDSGNVTIQAVKNFPALIVGHDLSMQAANTNLSVTGYTQVDHHIDMHSKSGNSVKIYGALYVFGDGLKNTNGCSLSVAGMPNKACLAIWSSGSNLTRWSPAAGAFFKEIKR